MSTPSSERDALKNVIADRLSWSSLHWDVRDPDMHRCLADAVLAAGYRPQEDTVTTKYHDEIVNVAQKQIHALEGQLAERDAVIAKVRRWDAANTADNGESNYFGDGTLDDILSAAPASVLAEVKAQVLEEAAEMRRGADAYGVENVPADWLIERAAEYREGKP